MQEAGPMNFLRTIAIFLLIYYGFKFLVKLFAPFLLKKMVGKMQQKAEAQFGDQQEKPDIKEGETVIDKKPQDAQQGKKSVGEYVDFEEID